MTNDIKLGVSYTVFEDSIELLPYALKAIRPEVEYISVVYQMVSNSGEKASPQFRDELARLRTEGLIDRLDFYIPDLQQSAAFNELQKRNIGLTLSRQANCTHHMATDSDEFFTHAQFELIKKDLRENISEAQFAQMKTFYKLPTEEITPPDEYFVPLFYAITPTTQYVLNAPTPVVVDPTRSISTTHYRIFKREEVEMYHMSYVRKDIEKKLRNSSAVVNFAHIIPTLVAAYKKWQPGDQVLLAGTEIEHRTTHTVPNLFAIDIN